MQRIKTLSEYFKKYELSEKDPESFWSEIADSFTWKKKWDKVLDWDFEKANTINHKAVELIAQWSKKNNCKLIHISTDYVYDGTSLTPVKEDMQANPVNNYGKTKLFGDIACLKNNPSSIIIRTCWLYSSFGNNFVTNMINLMKSKSELKIINDLVMVSGLLRH